MPDQGKNEPEDKTFNKNNDTKKADTTKSTNNNNTANSTNNKGNNNTKTNTNTNTNTNNKSNNNYINEDEEEIPDEGELLLTEVLEPFDTTTELLESKLGNKNKNLTFLQSFMTMKILSCDIPIEKLKAVERELTETMYDTSSKITNSIIKLGVINSKTTDDILGRIHKNKEPISLNRIMKIKCINRSERIRHDIEKSIVKKNADLYILSSKFETMKKNEHETRANILIISSKIISNKKSNKILNAKLKNTSQNIKLVKEDILVKDALNIKQYLKHFDEDTEKANVKLKEFNKDRKKINEYLKELKTKQKESDNAIIEKRKAIQDEKDNEKAEKYKANLEKIQEKNERYHTEIENMVIPKFDYEKEYIYKTFKSIFNKKMKLQKAKEKEILKASNNEHKQRVAPITAEELDEFQEKMEIKKAELLEKLESKRLKELEKLGVKPEADADANEEDEENKPYKSYYNKKQEEDAEISRKDKVEMAVRAMKKKQFSKGVVLPIISEIKKTEMDEMKKKNIGIHLSYQSDSKSVKIKNRHMKSFNARITEMNNKNRSLEKDDNNYSNIFKNKHKKLEVTTYDLADISAIFKKKKKKKKKFIKPIIIKTPLDKFPDYLEAYRTIRNNKIHKKENNPNEERLMTEIEHHPIITNANANIMENVIIMKSQIKAIEEEAKYKEKILHASGGVAKNPKVEEDLSQCILDAVKAKICVIDMITKNQNKDNKHHKDRRKIIKKSLVNYFISLL